MKNRKHYIIPLSKRKIGETFGDVCARMCYSEVYNRVNYDIIINAKNSLWIRMLFITQDITNIITNEIRWFRNLFHEK
jgi:hypothetical protein